MIKYNLFNLTSVKVFTPKGEFLCVANRVTETHPMAKLLGTVEDLEDYKQKIVKQKQLKKRTIKAVKKYLSNDETKFLEMHYPSPQPSPSRGEGAVVEKAFKSRLNGV